MISRKRWTGLALFGLLAGCGGGDDLGTVELAQLAAEGYLTCEGHAPPAEALAACDGLAADAACGFTHDDHEVTGTCRQPPDASGTLACAPDRPHFHALPPAEAIAACDGLAADAACAFALGDHDLSGTCREARDDSGTLSCAPHLPQGCDLSRPDHHGHGGHGGHDGPAGH